MGDYGKRSDSHVEIVTVMIIINGLGGVFVKNSVIFVTCFQTINMMIIIGRVWIELWINRRDVSVVEIEDLN